MLPLLLAGWPPIPLAVLVGSGVTVATLILTEGFSRTTLAAVLGTLGAVAALIALRWTSGLLIGFAPPSELPIHLSVHIDSTVISYVSPGTSRSGFSCDRRWHR